MNDTEFENKNTATASGETQIPLMDIAMFLLSKIHWVLIVGVVCGAIAGLFTYRMVTPMYSSYVTMYISASDQLSSSLSSSQIQAAERLAMTYAEILRSSDVAQAVSDRLTAEEGRATTMSRDDIKDMVKVSVVSDTMLLKVEVSSPDPQAACDVAWAFGEEGPGQIQRITEAGVARLVDSAEVSTTPSSRGVVRNTVIGFLIGVILVAAVCTIRVMSDTTLYLEEDVEKAVDITILGQVPDFAEGTPADQCWKMKQGDTIKLCSGRN